MSAYANQQASRPKILFVDHSAKPGGGQLGLERFLRQTRAVRAGLVVVGTGHAFDRLDEVGVEVYQFGIDGPRCYTAGRARLAGIVRSFRPDLIVANSTKAAAFVATLRRPDALRVLYMRDDLNPERNSWAKLAVMRRVILPQFDAFIANSHWTLSTLPPELASTRPTSVAFPVSGTSATQVPMQRPGVPVFLSLSRLDHWKGVHHIVRAAEQLVEQGYRDRFRVVIAGSSVHAKPDYEESLRAMAARMAGSVEFVGHQSDVAGLLGSSTSLICASLTPEPFGQVIVQGISAGCVVIATNAGGPAEILRDGAGLLVRPDDSGDLADAMRLVIDRPVEASVVAAAGLRRSAQFRDDLTVRSLEEALAGLAERWHSIGRG